MPRSGSSEADPRQTGGHPGGTLLSVNVGMPRDVPWQGRTVFTGVFKDPVTGPRRVRRLNVDGDGQGDLAGHGGEQRAVFVYQLDSYRYWERELGRNDFVYGQFGENFTVEGLGDDEVCIGDRYRIGTAIFEVTQPRVTCYRVGIRMNDPRIPALLVSHHRPGFYFRVLEEGDVQAGDEIVKLASGPEEMAVADVDALLYLPGHTRQQLLRALRIPALSPGWQASFRALLEAEQGSGNAGLAVDEPSARLARLPSADRHRDHTRERLGDLDPPRGPRGRTAAGRRARASTSRCASSPTRTQRPLLRNYSLSGPPDGGFYRITVKRERDGAASGYPAHPARRRRPARRRGAARHLHPGPDGCARAADQRRDRRHPGARHAPGAGGGALRSGDLVAARRAQRPRRTRSPPRPGRSSTRSRTHPPTSLQPSRSGRRRGPRLRQRGPPDRVGARRARPTPRRRGVPLRAHALHGRDQRRSGGDRDRRITHPHRALRARCGSDAGHRGDAGAAAPPARRASPEAARRSSSPAATSPSRGAASTRACSSSPKPATYPSAGRAAPASATTARPPSSPAMSTTAPTRSSRPRTEARSSAARSRATTSCSICDRHQRGATGPPRLS